MTVLGAAFKENVTDVRNSGVAQIVGELRRFDVEVQVHDPIVDPIAARAELGIALTDRKELRPARAVVLAVGHDVWRGEDAWDLVSSLLAGGAGVVADVQCLLPRARTPPGVRLWRL